MRTLTKATLALFLFATAACSGGRSVSSSASDEARSTGAIYHYTPTGYVEMADALIAQGRVRYDCESRRIVTDLKEGTPEWEWFEDSYLKGDIERFNEEQGGQLRWTPRADLFIIEGCRLTEVNRYAHRISLPQTTGEIRQWEGDLAYARGDAIGTLRGDYQSIAISKPRSQPLASDHEDIPVWNPKPSRSGAERPMFSPVVAGFYFPPAIGRPSANVRAIGPFSVLTDVRPAGADTDRDILIMGRPVPNGRGVVLHDGDWVQFAQRGKGDTVRRETYLYAGKDLTSIISSAGLRNTDVVRTTEPNTLGFVPDLVDGLNEIYRDLSEEGVRLDRSGSGPSHLDLTIRPDTQRTMTNALADYIETRKDLRHNRPRRAGVTILDAFTGDTLALASYPSRPEQIAAFSYLSDGARRRLLANQNFARHPIGSAGKPFWMSAILEQYPVLASFAIPPHNEVTSHESVLGHPLQTDYEDHLHRDASDITLARALGISCNKYMIDLATTALAMEATARGKDRITKLTDAFRFAPDALPKTDRFSVCGLAATNVPLLDRYLKGDESMVFVDQSPMVASLASIAGVRTHEDLAPEEAMTSKGRADSNDIQALYRTARFHAVTWLDVISPLEARTATEAGHRRIQAAFAAVSPEAVNLGINTVNGLRSRWINMLLGGSSSVWNNVQLAEATSRIVTGRDVRARFVGNFGPASTTPIAPHPRAPFLEAFDERARRPVLAGMRRVILDVDGTGANVHGLPKTLADAFPGYHAYVFAKTGTPAVELLEPSAFVRNIARLYHNNGLSYDPAKHRVALTPAGQQLLRGMPGSRAAIEGLLERMREQPEDFDAEQHQRRKNGPLYIQHGQLLFDETVRSAVATKGGVFLLSIVLMPEAGASTAAGPVAACLAPSLDSDVRQIPTARALGDRAVGVTLAVHIDDIPNTSVIAVDFTARPDVQKELIHLLRVQIEQQKQSAAAAASAATSRVE